MSDFDVAIVGAGPAGSWAAHGLAAAGARVAILDASHPREKPCGGGLSSRALNVLSPLTAEREPAGVEIRCSRFSAGTRVVSVGLPRLDPRIPALLVSSRREFDLLLLTAACEAGAEHLPERVTAIDLEGSRWTITTRRRRLTAGWLIGADGATSLVRRRVGWPLGRGDLSVASGYYVHDRSAAHIDIAFTDTPPGYLWSFPRPDHLAVGICGQANATSSAQLLHATAEWIRKHVDRSGSGLTPYSWPIPSLSEPQIRREQPAGNRWLLVGDAAGLVDPITREGIYFALESARLAVRSLSQAQPAAVYASALRGVYGELRKAARIKDRFFQASFTALLVRALQQSEGVRRIMAGLVSGTQTYSGLRRRLLLTGELRLAADYLLGRQ